MRSIYYILFLFHLACLLNAQIVADHRVVDRYDEIPEQYMSAVKTMLVSMAGQSHSGAYRYGQLLLQELHPEYRVLTFDGQPPAPSDQYLRIGRHKDMGENSFFSADIINDEKWLLDQQNSTGNMFDVIGFGWCWDMTWQNDPGGLEDPVYKVRWAGSTSGGPDGNMRWGLDNEDEGLTNNSVCMDTYLLAIEDYNAYCQQQSFGTRWIFTTGPVDGNAGTENGFQRELKHDYIRAFVEENHQRVLFDYADILCWNNAGEKHMAQWNDGGDIRAHAQIHPDNMKDYDSNFNIIPGTDADEDHIGEVGALRLAKAMWWLLARMAGWDGGSVGLADEDRAPEDTFQMKLAVRSGLLALSLSEELPATRLQVLDINGRVLKQMRLSEKNQTLDLNSLAEGMYILVLSGESLLISEKFILTKD